MKNKWALFSCCIFIGILFLFFCIKNETSRELPERWYAGDYGRKPMVRSQGELGACWALSSVSALETMLLPEDSVQFSADHMLHENSYEVDTKSGGDAAMIMAYLTSWKGPVLESQDPYGDGYSPSDLESTVHVQEIQILDQASTEQLKEAVYRYGAVQTSLYMNRTTTAGGKGFYQEETSSYYYPLKEKQNHDVLILGWDDNWSASSFAIPPVRDGAFICQNTWGSDFGEDGIFYISYADANIGCKNMIYSRIEPTDNYDRIYQNDSYGWVGRQGYESETCWFSNVYHAEKQESLKAVGFYATGENASWEVYLVHDFADTDSFQNRKLLQTGTFAEKGYYTVSLREEEILSAGEAFVVIVKITVPNLKNPVAVEYRSGESTANVSTEGKEGYLSPDGSFWQNTELKFDTNVCLKAYTSLK